jgi:predicted metal-dependent hydrolase
MKTVFENLQYTLRKVKGAKSIRITIKPGGQVLVTAPMWVPQYKVREFVESKKAWVLSQQAHALQRQTLPSFSEQSKHLVKAQALRAFSQRLKELNLAYGFEYKRVSIRDQSTRWGSCSKTGTLSFNFRLYTLRPEIQDYVLVHELCHLKEMNHSPRFWALVARTLPDYLTLRRELKREHF